MKKILIGLILVLFLVVASYAEDIAGLSFFFQQNNLEKTNVSFGITLRIIQIGRQISLGADWSVFNSSNQKKNLIGWSFRLHFKRLIIPIGYDFSNDKFYIGLGANF